MKVKALFNIGTNVSYIEDGKHCHGSISAINIRAHKSCYIVPRYRTGASNNIRRQISEPQLIEVNKPNPIIVKTYFNVGDRINLNTWNGRQNISLFDKEISSISIRIDEHGVSILYGIYLKDDNQQLCYQEETEKFIKEHKYLGKFTESQRKNIEMASSHIQMRKSKAELSIDNSAYRSPTMVADLNNGLYNDKLNKWREANNIHALTHKDTIKFIQEHYP